MRAAQILSPAIYMAFIALITVLFRAGPGADVTTIIEMARPVALVLPVRLAVAATAKATPSVTSRNTDCSGAPATELFLNTRQGSGSV